MDRLLTNAYNEDVPEIDGDGITVGPGENGHMIENLDGPNASNNFGPDEWIRRLQQQESMTGQGEALLNSPQPSQFRLSYEGNMNATQKTLNQGTDQMMMREPRETQPQHLGNTMPRVHSIDGLQQIQGVDDMTALNNLIQQQQHSSLPKNTNQATDASLATLGTAQTLEQQLATLQQQQQQPVNNQTQTQQAQQTQQLAAQNLQESLLQLQKLHQQQQQIIKNISQTGLVVPNTILNPLGPLLNTLIGQMNGNNTSTTNINGNNDNGNNTMINSIHNTMNSDMNPGTNNGGTVAWDQMGGSQPQHLANNPLQAPGAMMPSLSPQIQPQAGFAGPGNAPLPPPQALGLPPSTIRNKRAGTNNAMYKSNVNRGPSPNTNINIEFPTPPIIRKNENSKSKKAKSFPTQLWDAMMTKGPSNDAAFEWLPDGKSFVVVDSAFFCKEILDRKFKQSKYGSFVRKLHRWGFIRLTSGTGTDCFHHPLFQRSRPELVTQIKCNSRNGKDGKKNGQNAYARGEIQDSVQPSLMGVEKFIRAKVVSTETDDILL